MFKLIGSLAFILGCLAGLALVFFPFFNKGDARYDAL